MQIYEYIVETELDRYHYHFSYTATREEILELTDSLFNGKADLFDIFPEPNVTKGILKEPIKIITKIGKEMYLPPGIGVEITSVFRFLFQYSDQVP